MRGLPARPVELVIRHPTQLFRREMHVLMQVLVAWTKARKEAGVDCRFHDLRHTCVTRLLEQKVAFPVVASLMGWSPATTTRMAKRHAHFADSATRQAMETLDRPTSAEQAEADRRDTVQ